MSTPQTPCPLWSPPHPTVPLSPYPAAKAAGEVPQAQEPQVLPKSSREAAGPRRRHPGILWLLAPVPVARRWRGRDALGSGLCGAVKGVWDGTAGWE